MSQTMTDKLPDWLRKAARFNPDPLAAARALRPIIEAGADEGARLGFVPEPVMRAIAESGLFGLMVSRSLGGIEADAATYIDCIEELSYADGSTGWVMMANTQATARAGATLGPAAIQAIFHGDEGFVSAGQISSLGKAERVDGGYRVSGQFHFGSGSLNASWFFGAFILEKDGQPVPGPDGKRQMLFCSAPRDKVRLTGNWDVMGLSATGSYDFQFIDQVIPDDFVRQAQVDTARHGPIHTVGASIGHAAWSLGVARRAIDEIKHLAQSKRRFGRTTLIDQPLFQRDFAQHCAAVKACRAYVHQVFADWYAAAQAGEVSLEIRAEARMAACWITEICAKAGEFAYLAGGSDSLRNKDGGNTLQRCFRDLYAGTQHRHIDSNIMLECSQVILGVAPPELEL
jgi:alkylation response protein AidB-like acyl-CoA dehydrogenase